MYLCKYICGYIGEHIVDVQFVHHYPNGNSHNQGIQRADYRKTKNACRLFHSPTLYLLLLFHFNNQIQFIQLLLVNSRRCIQHYIASTVVLGECNAVADTVETCEDADPTVQTVCQTTVRSAPYLKAFIRKPNCS